MQPLDAELIRMSRRLDKKMAHVVDTVEPEEELVAKYEEKYQKFKKLYPTLKPLF